MVNEEREINEWAISYYSRLAYLVIIMPAVLKHGSCVLAASMPLQVSIQGVGWNNKILLQTKHPSA